MTKSKPVAVLISDQHYTPATLELATCATKAALAKAEELQVPLIDCGDITDTKSILRAEVVNRLIDIFSAPRTIGAYALVGNHSLCNEKGNEHAIRFLQPYVEVIQAPLRLWGNVYAVPYQSDAEMLQSILNDIPKGSTILMHQGVTGAHMGHYIVDKTSLSKESYADFRVIGGHYHRAQSIKCGPPRKGAVGLFSYVGNPYTLNFGEANDGPKGFQVLYDNGILEMHELPLRRHVIKEVQVSELTHVHDGAEGCDLLWVKVKGTKSELSKVTRQMVAEAFSRDDFKLDLIATDEAPASISTHYLKMNDAELLDHTIDRGADLADNEYLKKLWREIDESI